MNCIEIPNDYSDEYRKGLLYGYEQGYRRCAESKYDWFLWDANDKEIFICDEVKVLDNGDDSAGVIESDSDNVFMVVGLGDNKVFLMNGNDILCYPPNKVVLHKPYNGIHRHRDHVREKFNKGDLFCL